MNAQARSVKGSVGSAPGASQPSLRKSPVPSAMPTQMMVGRIVMNQSSNAAPTREPQLARIGMFGAP